MPLKYVYLILGILFGVFWLLFYIVLPKSRKEILVTSILFACAGLLADYFYFQDWWNPITLSGGWMSFEGVITALFIGGLSSVVFYIFTSKIENTKNVDLRKINKTNFLVFIIGLLFLLPLIFFITKRNSFYATVISLSIMIILMLFKRPDLIWNSVISGISLVTIAILIYFVLDKITPNWVESFWIADSSLSLKILSLPVNDIFWYLLGGMYMGPLFEVLYDKKF